MTYVNKFEILYFQIISHKKADRTNHDHTYASIPLGQHQQLPTHSNPQQQMGAVQQVGQQPPPQPPQHQHAQYALDYSKRLHTRG